jgi:hypothetical protein
MQESDPKTIEENNFINALREDMMTKRRIMEELDYKVQLYKQEFNDLDQQCQQLAQQELALSQ